MSESKSKATTDDQIKVLRYADQHPDASPKDIANAIDDPHIKQGYVESILNGFRLPDDHDTDTAEETAENTRGGDDTQTETDEGDEEPELEGVRRNDANHALEKLGKRTAKQRGYIVAWVLRGRMEDVSKTWLSKVVGASQSLYRRVEKDHEDLIDTLADGIDHDFITANELLDAARPFADDNYIEEYVAGQDVTLDTEDDQTTVETHPDADQPASTDGSGAAIQGTMADSPLPTDEGDDAIVAPATEGDTDIYLGLTSDEAFDLLTEGRLDVDEELQRRLFDGLVGE